MSLELVVSEREQFNLSGPLDLTSVDWYEHLGFFPNAFVYF